MVKHHLILCLLLLTAINPLLYAQSSPGKKIYKVNMQEEISRGMARQFTKAVDEAEAMKADILLINMNTYGGMLDAADSIRTRLLNTSLYSVVYINNNAASAGALIAIACNKIYMRKGASIGAATVVDAQGEVVPDKYQSYMRSMMRSTAEARQRNPAIAEAMVDPRTYIEGINDSGKVLTMTSTEALANNYCNGIAESMEEVLQKENAGEYILSEFKPSWVDRLIGFLINPAVSGVLILLMLGGIYYELQAPGIGFPLITSIAAAVLYFAPLYLEGLAANWEVLIAVVGFILIVVELFVIPGFGIAGISGIILVIFGLTVSMLGNDGFDFSLINMNEAALSLAIVLLSTVGALVFFMLSGKAVTASPAFSKMILQTEMSSDKGYTSAESNLQSLIGKQGIAVNMLRPSGKVQIEDNIYTAQAYSGYIDSGKSIIVVKYEMGNLFVTEISDDKAGVGKPFP